VIPGLIDTRLPAYGGAVELLDHGVTGVFDYCRSVNSPDRATSAVRVSWTRASGRTSATGCANGKHLTPDIEKGMGKPVAIFDRATRLPGAWRRRDRSATAPGTNGQPIGFGGTKARRSQRWPTTSSA
jgi:hypothetical protein